MTQPSAGKKPVLKSLVPVRRPSYGFLLMPYKESYLKLTCRLSWGLWLESSWQSRFMTMSKPLLTPFGSHHILESCLLVKISLNNVPQLGGGHRQRHQRGWWLVQDLGSECGDREGWVGQLGPLPFRPEHLPGRLLWPVRPLGIDLLHSSDAGPTILRHKVSQTRQMVRAY